MSGSVGSEYYSDLYYSDYEVDDDVYYSHYYYSDLDEEASIGGPRTIVSRSLSGRVTAAKMSSGQVITGRAASGRSTVASMRGGRTVSGRAMSGRTMSGRSTLGVRTQSGVGSVSGGDAFPERTTTVMVDFHGAEPPKEGDERTPPSEVVYYNQKINGIVEHFTSNLEMGLTTTEATRRLENWGPNELPTPPPKSKLAMLLTQFSDFMIIVLCVVALFELAMQEFIEASVLIIVVLLNVVTGFVQEVKAEKALSALASFNAAEAKVMRDGNMVNVDARTLVPGDIVLLEEGDQIPADLRLFEVNALKVDEAKLTGETEPIEKLDERLVHEGIGLLPLGDRRNMAFMSTLAVNGVGWGIVVTTGQSTKIGGISSSVSTGEKKIAPMQRKLGRLAKFLVLLSVVLCALVMAVGLIRVKEEKGEVTGEDWRVWGKVGVSLAVAVIPEGLIAVVTVSLALGVQRISKVNTIVRNMPAVETLGSVTVICSDKTGTLTEGKMRSEKLFVGGEEYEISGTGIVPTGEFVQVSTGKTLNNGFHGKAPETVLRAMQVCALCNNSALTFNADEGTWEYTGDPTEVALEVAARKLDLGLEAWTTAGYSQLFQVPFTSDRKRMSSCFRMTADRGPYGEKKNSGVIASKGALGFLMPHVTQYLNTEGDIVPITQEHVEAITYHNGMFSSQGLRTLALAYKPVSRQDLKTLDDDQPELVESDLIFCGLIAMRDPPRQSAREAVEIAKNAGIQVTMITGDHPTTAKAIATQLGILESGDSDDLVVTGAFVDRRTAEELRTLPEFPRVFARVSPANKLALVKALQMRGNIVAMTGDGVNDAPAIRHADVGIAMGAGTQLTREVADCVLLRNEFKSILGAVREGRVTRDNISKYLIYLLTVNGSEILTMLVSVAVGLAPPFSPIMILYANVLADVPPSLALGVDTAAPDVMTRLPRNPAAPLLSLKTCILIAIQAVWISTLTMGIYLIHLAPGLHEYGTDHDDVEAPSHARSVTFIAQAFMHLAHTYAARSSTTSIFRPQTFENAALNWGCFGSVLLLVVIAYIPGLKDELDQVNYNFRDWGYVLAAVVIELLGTEVLKFTLVKHWLRSQEKQVAQPGPSWFQEI